MLQSMKFLALLVVSCTRKQGGAVCRSFQKPTYNNFFVRSHRSQASTDPQDVRNLLQAADSDLEEVLKLRWKTEVNSHEYATLASLNVPDPAGSSIYSCELEGCVLSLFLIQYLIRWYRFLIYTSILAGFLSLVTTVTVSVVVLMTTYFRRGVSLPVERGRKGEEWIQLVSAPETTDSEFIEKKLNSSLYQLYGHSSLDRTRIDVVFFHGVAAGDYEDTWRTTWMTDPDMVGPADQGQFCWPGSWLGVEYPQSRILAASYDSSAVRTSKLGRVDMTLIAETLVSDLIVLGKVGSRPFVLVGHSLGCLVIKELIMHVVKTNRIDDLNSQTGDIDYKREDFLNNLRGCFFYSPPSHGVSFNVWQDYFPRSAGPLMTDLEILNSNTQRLNEEFRKWRHSQLHKGLSGIPVWAIWETHTSIRRGLMNREGVVVVEASARFDVDNFATVPANHMSVCMPANKEHDSRFLLFLEFLKSTFDEMDLKPSSHIEDEKTDAAARKRKRMLLLEGNLMIVAMSIFTQMLISVATIHSLHSWQSVVVSNGDHFRPTFRQNNQLDGGFHSPGYEDQFTNNRGNPFDFFDTIKERVDAFDTMAKASGDAFESQYVWSMISVVSNAVYFALWLGLIAYTYNLEPRGIPLRWQDFQLPPHIVQIIRGPRRQELP